MAWKTIIATIALLIIAIIGAGWYWIKKNENVVADFLIKNPDRSSVYWVRNDTLMADLRSDKKFPLASTVKIIIAIEYAQQAAKGTINPQEAIALSDLSLFYIPETDGGAHPNWLKEMKNKGKIQNNTVPLEEVAKGMIKHSSNANTEYLMHKLGLDNINANLKALNLPQHDPLYPIVSALFAVSNVQNEPNFLEKIKQMPLETYRQECLKIHEKLKYDTDTSFRKTFVFPDMDLQKVWSDRLPASTTKEYASIMQKINNRTYFPPVVQTHLDGIMEWLFEANPDNKKVYKHLGQKGGSTAFVLTLATYTHSIRGNKTELVFFFNDLTEKESTILGMFSNDFILQCLSKSKEMSAILKSQ